MAKDAVAGIILDEQAILVLSCLFASPSSKNNGNGAALEVAWIMYCCSICAMASVSARIIRSVEQLLMPPPSL